MNKEIKSKKGRIIKTGVVTVIIIMVAVYFFKLCNQDSNVGNQVSAADSQVKDMVQTVTKNNIHESVQGKDILSEEDMKVISEEVSEQLIKELMQKKDVIDQESLQTQIDLIITDKVSAIVKENIKTGNYVSSDITKLIETKVSQAVEEVLKQKDTQHVDVEELKKELMTSVQSYMSQAIVPNVQNGKDGLNGKNGKDGKNGENGKDGKDGKDGYTPIAGVDYFTNEEIAQIAQKIERSIIDSGELTVTGKSAYEDAVENGYKGSLTQWLEDLKGESAYQIAVNHGFEGSEQEWLEQIIAHVKEEITEQVTMNIVQSFGEYQGNTIEESIMKLTQKVNSLNQLQNYADCGLRGNYDKESNTLTILNF